MEMLRVRPFAAFGMLLAALLVSWTVLIAFPGAASPEDELLRQLRQLPTSTLADAVDEIVGRPGFMSSAIRPVSRTPRMVGRAKTVLLGPIDEDHPEKAIGGRYTVETIDTSGPGDVMIIVNNNSEVAAFGGLMAAASRMRGLEGVVIEGGVRDTEEIEALGLPVFARSVTPATGVGRQTSISRSVPVLCGGVVVHPGDYIVADRDGVVRVPAGQIEPVIRRALEMEETEKKMLPVLRETGSLAEVIRRFRRI
jgi:4-hydroxy-4-methyl-2-oxoglutarate aldolase